MNDSRDTKILDVRPIIPKEKHRTIYINFDSLSKGGILQLINDHDPKPLFYEMSAERSGQSSWEYLEPGPEVWRVNIKKIV